MARRNETSTTGSNGSGTWRIVDGVSRRRTTTPADSRALRDVDARIARLKNGATGSRRNANRSV